MFELNIKYDIDRYSPDTRQAIQTHECRVDDLRAMHRAIELLELAERDLKACGQVAHAESVEWTADRSSTRSSSQRGSSSSPPVTICNSRSGARISPSSQQTTRRRRHE